MSEWDRFIDGWVSLVFWVCWDEEWRRRGYTLKRGPEGVVIFNPGAIRYMDSI